MFQLVADLDLFRWHISLDIDDMAAILTAFAAILGVILIQRRYNRNVNTDQVVDADVLGKFLDLTNEVASLRVEVASARAEIVELRNELGRRTELEEYLRGEIHARDKQIADLQGELDRNRDRITHLEEVVARAGINGDEVQQ